MAYSVDWESRVITVPQADLTFLSAGRYKLDLDEFRRKCRALEADPLQGLSYDPIIQYYPAVDTGDVILGRVVLMINNYELELEDTIERYSALFDGANTNLHNNSLITNGIPTPNNSAGLQDLSTLLSSAYQGVVVVDVISGQAGTAVPIGTLNKPCSNIPDAITIANKNGIGTIRIVGDITLDTGDDLSGFIVYGQSAISTAITVNTGANTLKTEFRDATISGVLDGNAIMRECLTGELSYVSGFLDRCGLGPAPITLDGANGALLIDCFSTVPGSDTPTIDMGGFGSSLVLRGYSGGIAIQNRTGTDPISIDMESGHIKFNPTVSATSNIFVRGKARMTDNSTGPDKIDSVGLDSGPSTVKGSMHVAIKSTGQAGTASPLGTMDFPVNNVADALTIAKANSVMMLHIMDTITTAGTEDLSMYTIKGTSPVVSNLIITAGTTTTNTTFKELNLSGALSGTGSVLERCQVGNLTGVQNYMYQCFFYGTVGLSGNTTTAHCSIAPVAVAQKAYFDFGGLASTVIISDWGAGIATFKNMVTGSFAGISGTGGRIELDVSNTGGTLVHGGSLNLNAVNLDSVDAILDHSVAGTVTVNALTTTEIADEIFTRVLP